MKTDSPDYDRCFEVLRQSPLFLALEKTVLEDMLGIFQYQTRLKGETAISPQQALDRFYLIIDGRAKVSVYNPDNGREHILFLIGPGDGFDLIMNRPHFTRRIVTGHNTAFQTV
jgi:CRP-like cAMP-binding protein